MKFILVLLAVSVWTMAWIVKKASGDSDTEDGRRTVTEQTNNHLSHDDDRTEINCSPARSHRTPRNTEPCALHGCVWPKASDGKVYVPYVIANHYSSQQLQIIKRGMNSFSFSTCVRFFPRTNQRDYLYIQSLDGCYSHVGRRGNGQTVSLSRQGCIYYGTVQHELLHTLGFNHEHSRSDRDQHIQVLLQNVVKGLEFNFDKTDALNQVTPYDYGSVMHYGRLAFSKDNQSPSMVAVPDPKAGFGMARQMSQNDINRVNLLYCKTSSPVCSVTAGSDEREAHSE